MLSERDDREPKRGSKKHFLLKIEKKNLTQPSQKEKRARVEIEHSMKLKG
jgi:hypothetical protein